MLSDIDWEAVDLGSRPDHLIAKELGLSRRTITSQRAKLGIGSYRQNNPSVASRVDWDKVGLGTRTDEEIAQEVGVSRKTVAKQREKLGITPLRPPPERSKEERSARYQHAMAIDWSQVGLGKRSDAALSKELGVSLDTVRNNRIRLGIPAFANRGIAIGEQKQKRQSIQNIDWADLPLGKQTDASIAKQLGLSPITITKYRERLGIPSYQPNYKSVHWDKIALGRELDTELAARLKVSTNIVTIRRRARNIPAYQPPRQSSRQRWDALPLGKVPDAEIAREIGVSERRTAAMRSERGIPKIFETWLTYEGMPCGSKLEAQYDTYLHENHIIHQHQVLMSPLAYVADFKVEGKIVEIAGMKGYPPYDKRRSRKARAYVKEGLNVTWLYRQDVEKLFATCTLTPKRSYTLVCVACKKAAPESGLFCMGCYNKAYIDPECVAACKNTAYCAFCGIKFGWTRASQQRKYCPGNCRGKARTYKPRLA